MTKKIKGLKYQRIGAFICCTGVVILLAGVATGIGWISLGLVASGIFRWQHGDWQFVIDFALAALGFMAALDCLVMLMLEVIQFFKGRDDD